MFMQGRIEYIERVELPAAHAGMKQARKNGRYATTTAYWNLAQDLRNDLDAYQRAIDMHLDALAREELCHSPEAPKGSRSEGLTQGRANS